MLKQDGKPPVVTIDGLSGSGKGTISALLAKALNFHLLDSGALYRIVAWALEHYGISPFSDSALEGLIPKLDIQFLTEQEHESPQIFCDKVDVSTAIRLESCGLLASKISSNPLVRKALLEKQFAFRRDPGLVADGRDMGTVVFPDAVAKYFFTASVEERAKRRYNQLKLKGLDVNLREIQDDIAARDKRDSERAISPTKPADDAITIDTTAFSIEEVYEQVYKEVRACLQLLTRSEKSGD